MKARFLLAPLLGVLGACDEPRTPAEAGAVADHAGPAAEPAWFTDIAAEVGLRQPSPARVRGDYFMPEIMGAGVALFDFDGDGDLDVFLASGGAPDAAPGATAPNRLFRREQGGTYRDVTATSGLADRGDCMGATIGDYDNDGDLDLYVTAYGPDALYRNDGGGTFTDVSEAAGLRDDRWSCSAAFFDFDGDGWLDLYVANYVHYPRLVVCQDEAGRPEYCGPQSHPGTPDVLWRNNGDGTFTDRSDRSGIAGTLGKGLGVVCEDFNGDGRLDVYVANDGEANFLWMNNGDGTFTESATVMGVALNAFGNAEASMGVAAGDADGDGDVDLFMTHLERESNTFYRNGGRVFDDATAPSGLGPPSFPFTGFGTAFFDFDQDGDLDVSVANGRVKRGRLLEGADAASPLAAYAEPNLLFRNDAAGRFEDVSARCGPLCTTVDVSRGLATGDVDGDGDLDVLTSTCCGPVRLYRNDVAAGHWLIVRAIDPALRRDAFGARLALTAAGRTLYRTVNPASSYASASDVRVHFGLGATGHVDSIEIRWPDGAVERFEDFAADQAIVLERGRGD